MKKKIIGILVFMLIFANGFGIITAESKTTNHLPYKGHLRIYIVEPESRWNMGDGNPYHFGFLDWAYNDEVSIDYLDTFEETLTWQGDINEDNIIVMAAVFNQVSHLGYVFPLVPPLNLPLDPFEAHYVDASAAATPGNVGFNIVNDNFTHTVFMEEGTAVNCKYCPDFANTLYGFYESTNYPFNYVAMIMDRNQKARNRMDEDYNNLGIPEGYCDGGYEIPAGGHTTIEEVQSAVESCGMRDVHELNLSLSVDWLGDGKLEININITNNEEITTPLLFIDDVSSNLLKINTYISNYGAIDTTDINWNIIVYKTGAFKAIRIISNTSGYINNLVVNDKILIKTDRLLFGLGRVKIIVTADSVANVAEGFLLGIFLFITEP